MRAYGRREEDVTVICWAESLLPLGHERQYACMDDKVRADDTPVS